MSCVPFSWSLLEPALAWATLGLPAWPALRACASGPFRRAFPRESALLGAMLAVYAATLTAITVRAPVALRPLAVLAIGWLVVVHLHTRASRGRARGWPPGRLRLLPLEPWFQRWFFLEQHRRYGSPFKVSQFIKPMVCVVGLRRGLDLYRAHEASLASPRLWFGRFIPGGLMRHMEPAKHEAYRDIFRHAFGREVFRPLEPFIAATMRTALAHMAQDSAASGGRGITPRTRLQRMMFVVWAKLFFDVEERSETFSRLKSLYHVIDIRHPHGVSGRRIRAALAEISTLLERQLETSRAGAPEPASVLAALAHRHPEAVGDPGVIGNLIYEMHITWSDLSGFVQWLLRMLTDNPLWLERLRDECTQTDERQGDEPSLAARIVAETLRMEQSEHLYRVAERTIEHEGMVIPRGWLVRLCVHESHRDPEVFEHPDVFNPDRFLGRVYTRNEYSPFGAGRHACLGEPLARTVGRIFVEEIARGWQWHTVMDGPLEQSSWRHWRPSSLWRILLTARP